MHGGRTTHRTSSCYLRFDNCLAKWRLGAWDIQELPLLAASSQMETLPWLAPEQHVLNKPLPITKTNSLSPKTIDYNVLPAKIHKIHLLQPLYTIAWFYSQTPETHAKDNKGEQIYKLQENSKYASGPGRLIKFGSCSMKRLGVFLLPLDEMLVHCRAIYPALNSPVWAEKGTALWEWTVLPKNTTNNPSAWAWIQTTWLKSSSLWSIQDTSPHIN